MRCTVATLRINRPHHSCALVGIMGKTDERDAQHVEGHVDESDADDDNDEDANEDSEEESVATDDGDDDATAAKDSATHTDPNTSIDGGEARECQLCNMSSDSPFPLTCKLSRT